MATTFIIKAPIHKIRYVGENSMNKANFGQKYVIFTIDKKYIQQREITSKLYYRKNGGFNQNLIVITGYCKETLDEGSICNLSITEDNVTFDEAHKTYTIKCSKIDKLLEISEEGFKKYLKNKYSGIGAKKAEKIFDYLIVTHGESKSYNFKNIFEEECKKSEKDFKKILGPKKADELQKKLLEEPEKSESVTLTDEEIVFCSEYNLPLKGMLKLKEKIIFASTFKKKTFKEDSFIPYLKKNPYLLAIDDSIKQWGFSKVDNTVFKMLSKEDIKNIDFQKQRTIGFLKYSMNENVKKGSLYVNKEEILNFFIEYNEKKEEHEKFDIPECENELFEYLGGLIVALDEHINPFFIYKDTISLISNVKSELKIAKQMLKMKEKNINLSRKLVEDTLKLVEPKEWKLSDEQREAVISSALSPVSVITGGPGTGKTTISEMVIKLFKKLKKTFKIFAPTGTAAKRISSVVKEEATTIHRGLEFKGKFTRNELNPLKEDVIIIDESSMIDVMLGNAVINASINSQIIFIGDVNQLPSVGPGDFLRDVINSKKFQVSMLTKVFRQAGDNPIIQFAYKVNAGVPVKQLFPWYTKKIDVLDMKCSIPFKDRFKKFIDGEENQNYLHNMLEDTIKLGFQMYAIKSDNLFQSQILVANNRANNSINMALQDQINENGFKIPGTSFRVGDKIIQQKNNYNLNIFNGSIGVIRNYNSNTEEVFVSYMENQDKEINIDKKVFEKENKLCYSMTIHKSQGQEFKRVIMLISDFMLNNREMLYTGATRAKDYLTIISNSQLLSSGISTTNKKGLLGEKDGKQARKTFLQLFLTIDTKDIEATLYKEKQVLKPEFD